MLAGLASVTLATATVTPASGDERSTSADADELDTILRSGTVIDGSGRDGYVADVGISGGHIVDIGDLSDRPAGTEVDVSGKVVAPGFIDIHSHADLDALQNAESSLTQGVTTEILSPDGGGPTDINERMELEEDGLAINIGSYIGFNAVWQDVVGSDDRPAEDAEIDQMRELVRTAMAEGAWGVSAGLFYTPANYAETEQVIEVAEAARDWRTNFPNHIRNENNAVLEATEETIEIGEGAGLVPVITHMKVMGADNWGASEETVGVIEEANERGTYTAADMYPYLASQTSLTAMVPPWVQDGGEEAMLERFADPDLRPQIADEIVDTMTDRVGGPEDVYFPSKQQNLDEVAEELNADNPGEATMQILEDEGNLTTIYFFGDEEDLLRILQNPTTAIASDGGATESDQTHPRRYGTQPTVLGEYVRDEGYLSLEEAVRKMTGLPATVIGMVDRGYLAPGMAADVTVFDPEEVEALATFDDPQQYAEGIEQVIVNGDFAVQDGEFTEVQSGTALRSGDSMPSRPQNVSGQVSAKAVGQVQPADPDRGSVQIHMSARQNLESDERASGTLLLNDSDQGVQLLARDLGQLQADEDWASFTGRATVAGEAGDRAVTVILDRSNPLADDETTVTVQVEDEYVLDGTLTQGISTVSQR